MPADIKNPYIRAHQSSVRQQNHNRSWRWGGLANITLCKCGVICWHSDVSVSTSVHAPSTHFKFWKKKKPGSYQWTVPWQMRTVVLREKKNVTLNGQKSLGTTIASLVNSVDTRTLATDSSWTRWHASQHTTMVTLSCDVLLPFCVNS